MPDTAWNDLAAAHAATAEVSPATGEFPEHRPVAAVLACADARVDPSLLFGQPAGRLFVVRLAGNTATDAAVASLTYAVEALGTPLVVVLGHTGCGAVTAAFDRADAPALGAILRPIDTAIDGCGDVDTAIVANVRHNVGRLAADTGPLGAAITGGRVEVRGAVHDLRTGALADVTPEDLPNTPAPPRSQP